MTDSNYSYKFLALADSDWTKILNYIEYELSNPKAAKELADELFNKIDNICKFPESGARIDNKHIKDQTLRKFTAGNYIVFYKPDSELQSIIIMRIIYAGRELSGALKSMQKQY